MRIVFAVLPTIFFFVVMTYPENIRSQGMAKPSEEEQKILKAIEEPGFLELQDRLIKELPGIPGLVVRSKEDLFPENGKPPKDNAGNPENADVGKQMPLLGERPAMADRPMPECMVDFETLLRKEIARIDRRIWNGLYNIAHVGTPGYKAVRYHFPSGLPRFHAGSGQIILPDCLLKENNGKEEVVVSVDMGKGKIVETRKALDVAIDGTGFFRIIDSRTGNECYTRSGRMVLSRNSDLAFAVSYQSLDGEGAFELLEPRICIGEDAREIKISPKGKVWVKDKDGNYHDHGDLKIVAFANPEFLRPIDERFFEETDDSGPARGMDVNERDFPVLRQGFLECSNVEAENLWGELKKLHELRNEYRALLSGNEGR